ncbi:hypothetical protein L596_023274 [Steinernema carpocapsae]|uniref:Uncharacterized protein n=1 Tax=Steinernema carpocapsae TaxID=34508 RepID=A0A4U5MD48_STECR|nr:hypothetical protein L596_023274 [Steinernema carpocapsae]
MKLVLVLSVFLVFSAIALAEEGGGAAVEANARDVVNSQNEQKDTKPEAGVDAPVKTKGNGETPTDVNSEGVAENTGPKTPGPNGETPTESKQQNKTPVNPNGNSQNEQEDIKPEGGGNALAETKKDGEKPTNENSESGAEGTGSKTPTEVPIDANEGKTPTGPPADANGGKSTTEVPVDANGTAAKTAAPVADTATPPTTASTENPTIASSAPVADPSTNASTEKVTIPAAQAAKTTTPAAFVTDPKAPSTTASPELPTTTASSTPATVRPSTHREAISTEEWVTMDNFTSTFLPPITDADTIPAPPGYIKKPGNVYYAKPCVKPKLIYRPPRPTCNSWGVCYGPSVWDLGTWVRWVPYPCRKYSPLHYDPHAKRFRYTANGRHMWWNEKTDTLELKY